MGCVSSSTTDERDLPQPGTTEEFAGNRDLVHNIASKKVAWPDQAQEQEQQAAEPNHSLDELQTSSIEEPRAQLEYEREQINREREEFQQEKQCHLDERNRKEEEVQVQLQQLEIAREELNTEKKRNEAEIQSQQQQLQNDREELEKEQQWLESEKQKLQAQQEKLVVEKKRQQRDHDIAMKNLQQKYDEQMQEFKKLTSASRDSRKRNKDIRPGDITHEMLSTKFQEYYDTKFRTKLRKLKYSTKEERCHFLSTVLQVACKYCNEHVMEHMTKELSALYESPQSPRCMDPDQLLMNQSLEKWRDRSAAFGLLLSVVDIDPKQLPAWIKIEEVQDILMSESEPFKLACDSNHEIAMAVLNSALDIAWIMSTLVPPSSTDEPTTFYQQWHELVAISGPTADPEHDPYSLTYCRPVLFFGAEGTVGKVGSVKCFPATNDNQDKLIEKQEVQPITNQPSTVIREKSDKEQTEQEEDKFYDAPDTHTTQDSIALDMDSQSGEDSKFETLGNSSYNNESADNISQDASTMAGSSANDTQEPVQDHIEPDMINNLSAQITESLAEFNNRKIPWPMLDMSNKNDCALGKQQSLDLEMGTENMP